MSWDFMWQTDAKLEKMRHLYVAPFLLVRLSKIQFCLLQLFHSKHEKEGV